jgi:hypothetical protein
MVSKSEMSSFSCDGYMVILSESNRYLQLTVFYIIKSSIGLFQN